MYKVVKGLVVRGKQLGRTIGYRTANIHVDEPGDLHDGTYRINGIINGKTYKGLGVFFKEKSIFEAHFFDFDQDIYGCVVEIMVMYKIRDNQKFGSIEDLKNQIKKDVESAKSNIDYVLTFGTFDIAHPGHEYYLKKSKFYGDKLITIIATDENVYKFKNRYPKNKAKIRLKNIENLGISDSVIIGEGDDPLKWVDLYKPRVVCLGYDQRGFSDILENYLKINNLNTEIIRIDAFRDDIYKSSKLSGLGKIFKIW